MREGVAAPALRRPHRDLRGERQLRPARLPRRARAAHGRRAAGRRARFRRRQLRAALGDDVAARAGERHAGGEDPRARACTRAMPAAWCRRRSASRAQLLDRVDDSRTGVVKPAAFNCDIPADRHRAGEAGGRDPGRCDVAALPLGLVLRRPGNGVDLRRAGDEGPVEIVLNRTWRRRSPSPAPTACRPRASAGNVQRPFTDAQAVAAPAAARRRRRRRRRPSSALLEADPPLRRARRASTATRRRPAGTRRRRAVARPPRSTPPRRRASASPRPTWARAARFPSWACWA